MKLTTLIPEDHEQRLHAIIDAAWPIFQSQFIRGKHPILKEAPFQHHFANIISTVGALYCIQRDDTFLVDLETKCKNIKGKSKYLDITCSFYHKQEIKASCAIELKFKTAKMAAENHGLIDAYIDIEALELVCKSPYSFGRFYMITDSRTYVKTAKKGAGTVFRLDDGFQTKPGDVLRYPKADLPDEIKPKDPHKKDPYKNPYKDVRVTLSKAYTLEWTQHEPWYFLEVKI